MKLNKAFNSLPSLSKGQALSGHLVCGVPRKSKHKKPECRYHERLQKDPKAGGAGLLCRTGNMPQALFKADIKDYAANTGTEAGAVF